MSEGKETKDTTGEAAQTEDSNKNRIDLGQRFILVIYALFKGVYDQKHRGNIKGFMLIYIPFLMLLFGGNITLAFDFLSAYISKKYMILDVTSDLVKLRDPDTFASFGGWLIWVISLIFGFAVGVGFGELVGYFWRPLAVFLYGAYFIDTSFVLFAFLLLEKNKEARKSLDTSNFLTLVLILTGFLVVSFSETNRYLYSLFGGFTAAQAEFLNWLWFGCVQLSDDVFFEFFTFYNVHLSSIEATSLWSRTMLFLFNLELELIVIVVIVLQLQRMHLFRLTKKRRDE